METFQGRANKNYLGVGENVLYCKALSLSIEESVPKVYRLFTKWEMTSAKGLTSLREEDISRTGVQRKTDKFRLEMRHSFSMLMMINHCNQLQSEMLDPPSLDALQRSGCLFFSCHCIEDCAGTTEWNDIQDISCIFWHSKCLICEVMQRADGECGVQETELFPWKYLASSSLIHFTAAPANCLWTAIAHEWQIVGLKTSSNL